MPKNKRNSIEIQVSKSYWNSVRNARGASGDWASECARKWPGIPYTKWEKR